MPVILKTFMLCVFLLPFTGRAQSSFTLKDCIAYGLEHHPAIEVAKNNVSNAYQASREALAGYLPQVSVNANAINNLKLQTQIIPAGIFGPSEQRISFGNKYTTSVVADASQPIYNQSLITGLKANKPNEQVAELTMEQTRQNIIYNVSTAYYQVIVNQRQLQLLYSNRERIERLLKASKLQSEMGVAKKVDTKQVQVQYNNVNAQISVAENNVELAYNTLRNAMGIFKGNVQIALTDTARWLRQEVPAAQQPGFRFSSTVDYQLQGKQIELYDIKAKSIRASNYPVLSLFGQYGLNSFSNKQSDVFNRYFDYSSVGLRVSVSLFDGFKHNAQYREALIQRDNAKLNQSINEANQNLQFLNARSKLQRARTSLASNKDNVDLASEVYDNTSLQYRQGVGTLSDLLNAETSYNDAQNNYIQSLVDYYLSLLDIERANTTLEDYYKAL